MTRNNDRCSLISKRGGYYSSFTLAMLATLSAALPALGATVPPSYSESVLYAFTGGNDGGIPYASLIRDRQGNLYGTAADLNLVSPLYSMPPIESHPSYQQRALGNGKPGTWIAKP